MIGHPLRQLRGERMIKISFAEMQQSLTSLKSDSRKLFTNPDCLADLHSSLNIGLQGPGIQFCLEIPTERPLITIASPIKKTLTIDGQSKSVSIVAHISCKWDCESLPKDDKAKGKPSHFTVKKLATCLCELRADSGELISSFHSDIQAPSGPGPSMHFQLVDSGNSAKLDLPRILASQVNIVDFVDMVLSDLFPTWLTSPTTARTSWLGYQKTRLSAIFEIYREVSGNSGFHGIRTLCAHKRGVLL